jgi:hypothetical protein
MDRDRRLTGWLRGQVDRPIAPAGFEYSNGWRVRGQPYHRDLASWRIEGLTCNNTGREELALEYATHTANPYASHLLPLCICFLWRSVILQMLLLFQIPIPFHIYSNPFQNIQKNTLLCMAMLASINLPCSATSMFLCL